MTLTIEPDQTAFTAQQKAALLADHPDLAAAPDTALDALFYQSTTRGLDPFTGQVYLHGRTVNTRDATADTGWSRSTRWTVHTGIAGLRLVAHRAARRTSDTLAIDAPAWKRRTTGRWADAWNRQWGTPLAARVTVHRAGEHFTGVALFDEYVQVYENGHTTGTWEQRPAGQLAKCAEALALRMAFPEDLSGLYIDEELDHTSSPPVTAAADGGAVGIITADQIVSRSTQRSETPA